MEFPPMKRRRLKVDDRFICLHQSELKRMKKKLFEMTKKALYLELKIIRKKYFQILYF